MASNGKPSGFLRISTFFPTHSAAGVKPSTARSSLTTAPNLEFPTLSNALSPLKCSNLTIKIVFEGPLAHLEWEMQWLMMSAWADSTKRALSTEYKAFKAYCRIANISSLPVTGHQLAV